MFTLIVTLGAITLYGPKDDIQFTTQRDCMEAASAIVGVLSGRSEAKCVDQNGRVVSINSRSG